MSQFMKTSLRSVLAGFAAAVAAAAAVPAVAADAAGDEARGQALYEARCGGCHEKSVHGRRNRAATDFISVRGYVDSWQREVGAAWRDDEIDVVTRYLNRRYYRYPCPPEYCPAPRAEAQVPQAQVPQPQVEGPRADRQAPEGFGRSN